MNPGAPTMPGWVFRRYRGPSDHPEMNRVSNASRLASGDSEVRTVEQMDNDYAHLTNCDPHRDVTIVEVEGRMVAYGRVEWEDAEWAGRSYFVHGFVDPEWRGRGIGAALLQRSESRALEVARAHSYTGRRHFASWGNDRDAGYRSLMERHGYTPVRHFYEMVRPTLDDVDLPPLPDGLEVRALAERDWRALFQADNEAFLDHWGAVDGSEDAFQRRFGDPSWDPTLAVVAWDGDEIGAAVLNWIVPAENERLGLKRGWLESVFTRRRWRRRGLARALIGRSLVLLRERGMTSAALGVDAQNPNEALALYQGAGFEQASAATEWAKPMEI